MHVMFFLLEKMLINFLCKVAFYYHDDASMQTL